MNAKPDRKPKSSTNNTPTAEFLSWIDRVGKHHPAARLEADTARDAALEVFQGLEKQIAGLKTQVRRLLQVRKQRRELKSRITRLLHELSLGATPLPRPTGRPSLSAEELVSAFRDLRTTVFQEAARALHAAIGKKEVHTYEAFLTHEVCARCARNMAEYLVLHGHQPYDPDRERTFLDRLRGHTSRKVARVFQRKLGLKNAPELASQLEPVIDRMGWFLADLMQGDAPGWLLLPQDGCPFDPALHTPLPGRPEDGTLRVVATLFPGFVLADGLPRVVEKALVYTDRISSNRPPSSPSLT